jgi:hypothetical protein
LSRIAPYFIILLCSTPDDFTLQGKIMLWLNGQLAMWPVNPLSCIAPYFIILLCLMPDDFTHQGEIAAA